MSRSYELVRYPGLPFVQTHPDRLCTMARLFGLNPPPIDSARVLEIGCCDGGNLIPMALGLPGAEFVGIDLTEIDIAAARETVAALGLKNVSFRVLDLTTLPGEVGQFDYVIGHGVYSWVPSGVREKLLAVVKAALTPNGVAYISYNTLPGGHLRLMLREMMLYHNRGVDDPAEILSRSRTLLDTVAAAGGKATEYQAFLRHEIEQIFNRPNFGLFHDELEENYQPVYFHEFVDHATRYGLQYLSEANYFDMQHDVSVAAVAPLLDDPAADPIRTEQYLDFARCRAFRQTLLCHEELPIERTIRPELMRSFFLSSQARFVSEDEVHGPHNARIKTAHPLVLQLLRELVAAWPRAVAFEELPAAAREPGEAPNILFALFGAGLVELNSNRPAFALTPGERPVASPLVRWQASRSEHLTSLRHISIATTGDLEKRLISLLDGTRTREDLVAELTPHLQTAKTAEQLRAELDISLNTLGGLCLLVS